MRPTQRLAFAFVAVLTATPASLGQLYDPPTGGWTYIYEGVQASGGADFTALDGTWSHSNGSDEWDESEIGSGAPGGVTGGLSEDDVTFVRLQDTGNPTGHGFSDPGSNRKLYFGHDITAEGATDTILDDGVTISFRARLATGSPLDEVHPDGGGAITPWPAAGDGYAIHDGGKGSFTVHQNAGGTISFALANETDGAPGSVLRMNNLNGTSPSGTVDTGEAGTANELAIGNATAWHEFWITIEEGGSGTHQVQIFHDGGGVPDFFDVTAGSGNDFSGISYIAMGLGATPHSGAIDVDYFAWREGLFLPGASVDLGDFNADGNVDEDDFFILSDNLAAHLDGGPIGFEDGDIDFDGDVDLDDLGEFKALFPAAVAQALAIPEPATSGLFCALILLLSFSRLRKRGS